MISVAQFASRLGVSGARVRVWLKEGRIPGAKKVGRDWVIPANAERPEAKR